jgi:glutamate synthase (NADPH/NADH) small chain
MLPKAPEVRQIDNPWPQWPKVCKTDYGQEEAKDKFGTDPRIYETTVKKLIPDENGKLKALVTVGLKPKKDETTGRTIMTEVEGSEKTVGAEILIIAAGFLGPKSYIAEAFGVNCNQRSNIATETGHFKTNIDKVFTAGDMHRGQSLVVWAISEGRAAAKEVDAFLMGYSQL